MDRVKNLTSTVQATTPKGLLLCAYPRSRHYLRPLSQIYQHGYSVLKSGEIRRDSITRQIARHRVFGDGPTMYCCQRPTHWSLPTRTGHGIIGYSGSSSFIASVYPSLGTFASVASSSVPSSSEPRVPLAPLCMPCSCVLGTSAIVLGPSVTS